MRFNYSNTMLASKLTPVALATLLFSGAANAGTQFSPIVKGSEDTDIVTNIVGGTETQPYSRPYQVAMLYNGRQICGGTLISSQWVLTAAHCLDNVSATSLSIRVGAHRISQNDGQTIPVSQKIVHHNWYGANNIRSGNDIALLKLSSPASSQYTPAKLPTADIMSNYASVGRYVTVSGWGQTSNNSQGGSDVLREVDLPVISNSTCSQQLNYNMPASTICGGGAGGVSACRGDSGGPYALRANGEFYNVGIVSWGMNCVGATAFTRTYSFLDWIEQHSGVTNGDDPVDPDPGDKVLKNGVPVTGLSASQGQDVVYTMAVPAGSSNIRFTISGGSGDADLYTRFGSTPTDSAYDCRPWADGNNETCTGTQSGGTYHVRVKAYATFSGVTLTGSYSGGGTDPDDPVCSAPAWNPSTIYNTGNVVSQNGNEYQAQWWTQGDSPSASNDPWYVWKLVRSCR